MQKDQQDMFREAMNMAKQTVAWEKLMLLQKEELIAKCLLFRDIRPTAEIM